MRARGTVYRCPECRLHHSLCLCALIPTLETRTRVVLVLHQLETRKPTNTGRLAVRCLVNSEIVLRGRGASARPARQPGGGPTVLLFPHPDARPIEDFVGQQPLTLVVPDGTW